ncbi:MAG: VacJ family lipoprotein, partial [Pseudomonadota bacterium]
MRKLSLLLLATLLVGCATTSTPPEDRLQEDPWEPFNRSVHEFNNGVDRAILKPVAEGYEAVTPRPIRSGVRNFFRNLGSPVIMINMALQGRGKDLEQEFQRFFVNTVYGIGGLVDVASRADIEDNDADFGQTLHTWGWDESRYLVLPFLGPSTLRDGVGTGVDMTKDQVWQAAVDADHWGLLGLSIISLRADLLPLEEQREGVPDDYAFIRDSWLQRRNFILN